VEVCGSLPPRLQSARQAQTEPATVVAMLAAVAAAAKAAVLSPQYCHSHWMRRRRWECIGVVCQILAHRPLGAEASEAGAQAMKLSVANHSSRGDGGGGCGLCRRHDGGPTARAGW